MFNVKCSVSVGVSVLCYCELNVVCLWKKNKEKGDDQSLLKWTKKKGDDQSIIWHERKLMWIIRPKFNFSLFVLCDGYVRDWEEKVE